MPLKLGPGAGESFALCCGYMEDLCPDAFSLYERCISRGVVEYLQKQVGVKVRRSIYTAPVVLWLMIVQRLQAAGTLATGVEALVNGAADSLLSGCERARQKRISRNTGGYSHARQRLPKLLCRQVLAELVTRLREILNPGGSPAAYLLDGSSLELEASPSLRRVYPPGVNRHGNAHWPVLRIAVLHELETGLAQEPRWGPMYGSGAVSEQQLADQAMRALPPGSVVVGDRNFGVFSIAWQARQLGLEVVIRMTTDRARKVAGEPIGVEGERAVRWLASRFDGRRQGGMPEGAAVAGRLLAMRIGKGHSKEWLYLFTTLNLPQAEVMALYGKRWQIETDLRALKRTVRLQHIAARNESMMEKELLTAVAAYNLVRAVMALAARRHRISPRQLSFTFVLNMVSASWHRLQAATGPDAYRREVERMLDAAAQGVLPKRKKPRSFPRAVWRRGSAFARHKEQTIDTI
jgi:putative transposase